MDCIFCKIVNNEMPCYKIYEDENVLAFLDIKPSTNGHTVVIPKKHIKDIFDIDDNTLIEIHNAAKKVAKILENKLAFDGFTISQNNGSVQDIKHYHVHVKPRYKNEQKLIDVKDIFSKITN